MPATVALTGVSVTSIHSSHKNRKQMVYDGSASYQLKSDSMELNYIYRFTGADSIEAAVIEGADFLKQELDALSQATRNIQANLSVP